MVNAHGGMQKQKERERRVRRLAVYMRQLEMCIHLRFMSICKWLLHQVAPTHRVLKTPQLQGIRELRDVGADENRKDA